MNIHHHWQQWRQRRLFAATRNLLSLSLCASLISLPVVAQDPPATQNSQSQDQEIVARPVPTRTVGLEPGKVVKWTLRDAITTALEKNIDIELQRENVRLMQYDLIAAQGFYDPMTTSTILFNKSISPTSFRAAGLEGSNTINRDTLQYNFGASKNFERWGSLVEANFNNQRGIANTNTLTPQYNPQLEFRFTQPLFKNFEIDQPRRQIKIIKKRMDLTDAQFRQRVIEIISNVQQAYWDLSLAIRNETVAREAVKLAETQLKNNKRQVEVGTLAQIDIVSAATQLESRRQQVFQVMNQVGVAENTLKALVVGGPNDDLWSTMIEPVEPFDIKPYSIQVSEAVKLAQENRPEIRQQSLQKEINNVDVDFFRNQAKPQVDLIASYRTDGLAGSPLVTTGTAPNCSSPVLRDLNNPNSGLVCNSIVIGRDTAGNFIPTINSIPFNPAVSFTQTASINNQFVGGYGQALSNLFKNEFRTWSVGVQFSLPLRNRTAKANLGRSLEVGRQIDLQTRQLLQNIEFEVRNAVQAVETAKLRIEAARAATEYARKQLEGEEKRFAAGLSDTFLILTRQNELTQTQFSETLALADYNKAIATLQRVMSTTLSSNSVEIKADPPVTIK